MKLLSMATCISFQFTGKEGTEKGFLHMQTGWFRMIKPKIFNAQVWHPEKSYEWTCENFTPEDPAPVIYEAHIGMATSQEKIGTYNEFTENILPVISKSGYNTIQLMAIQEHPFYGSFGYHVSSFFAASSRFEHLKILKNSLIKLISQELESSWTLFTLIRLKM